jgi:ZIP family zinc transporter
MPIVLQVILLSAIAGLMAFSGALLGCLNEIKGHLISTKLSDGIIAFGGGALFGAVGLVLVPHGLESQPLWTGTITFIVGGVIFLCLDRYLQRRGTPVAQLIALMLDFVPEALVLGAVISSNYPMAIFLTVIISAQNLPEGFNAYREIRQSHGVFLRKHILLVMTMCIFVGPLAAVSGYFLFEIDSLLLGSIMTFCAGGILYLIFHDVAPAASSGNSWYPAFGAILGFSVALVGYGLTG